MPCRALWIALLLAALGVRGQAQPIRTNILAGTYWNTLVRTTTGGAVTTVGSFGALSSLIMDVDNRHLVAAEGFFVIPPFRILRIDPVAAAIVATLWSGAPFKIQIPSIDLDQDGDYIVCDADNPGKVYRLKADGSALTTILTAPAGRFFSSAIKDQVSGDLIVSAADFTARIFLRVSRDGSTVRTITQIAPVAVGSPMQDPHLSEIYYASVSTVLALEPSMGAVTSLGTVASPLVCLTVDRSPATSGGLIYACDQAGVLSYLDRNAKRIATLSTINAMSLVIDRSRNLASRLIKAPNHRVINVSFPSSASRSFVLAVSATGYQPGVPLPDGRVIPLTPDSLTLVTSRASIPPLIAGNIGVLDPSGGAVVTMDLNGLGSVVKGMRVWAAAVTLDPNAPLGIGEISRPFVLVL